MAAVAIGCVVFVGGLAVIYWAFRPDPEPCPHTQNYTERRWLADDGTPMADFHCEDCGHRDCGHVHADSRLWVGIQYVRNAQSASTADRSGA